MNIGSVDENNFIQREFLKEEKNYWIGLTDSETEDIWKWTSGATLSGYINWEINQPNNYNEQDCGAIKMNGKWHDILCSAHTAFICELI